MVHVSQHAIMRYQERVKNLPHDAVVALLDTRHMQQAADFGARIVRLHTGHRAVIANNTIITILSPCRLAALAKRR